jgi:predicted PurR-regulated permease PerM
MTSSRSRWLLGALALLAALTYLLQPILMPFLVGALLAYLGDPAADRLERLGLNRTLSVSVVFLVLTLVAVALLLLLIPLLGRQLAYLQSKVPAAVGWLRDVGLPYLDQHFGIGLEALELDQIQEVLQKNLARTGNIAAAAVGQITRSGLAFAAWLANLALIPVVAFYLLRDWDVLIERIHGLLPRRQAPVVARLARECDEVLGAFLRGQLLVMLALGIIYWLGLWAVGLELALLIGMLAGLASIVPYLGFAVGIIAATVAAFFQFGGDWLQLALVWGVFMIGQLLEGTVLTPLLVGDRIGLHPVAVIFAVLAGGQLFGFTGILLALPVAAVAMVLLRHAHDRYLASALYSE